jgi:hypothetical protein
MAAASAVAQNVVRQGETSQLRVEQMPGDTYTWDLYRDSTVNFAVAPGDCPPTDAYFPNGNTGATVDVTWLEPGIYFFRVLAVDAAGCTNNLEVGRMQVLEALPTATPSLDPDEILCERPVGTDNYPDRNALVGLHARSYRRGWHKCERLYRY